MIKKYKNIIKITILIGIIYIIYYLHQDTTEKFITQDNIQPYDTSFNEFEKISPAPEIKVSIQKTNECELPPKKLPPKFIYGSQYDDIVSSDPKVVFSGLKSELLDATHIPRVISKYVYPYIPQNYDIPLNNPDDKPWNHHVIINSIPRNLKPKYDNVFYYELDNDIYMNAFNKTFNIPCDINIKFKSNNWSDIYEPQNASEYIMNGYSSFIEYLIEKLNDSMYMKLKEDPKNKKPIQVVHDIFLNYRKHKQYKNIVLLHIEVLLYRENKYNGKHIGIKYIIINSDNNNVIFSSTSSPSQKTLSNKGPSQNISINLNNNPNFVITDGANLSKNGNYIFYILETELIGDVPEDMIALFPTTPLTQTSIPQITLDGDIKNKYAGILPTTANGKIYTGFGDISNKEILEKEKKHVLNHINFAQKNIDYTTQISNMQPEEAVEVLNKVNAELRHDVLSTVPSDFAARVLLLMSPEVQKQALFEMDKDAALNALYLITNPSKLGITIK